MNRLEEILKSDEKILVDKTSFMLLFAETIESWREHGLPIGEILDRVITVLARSNMPESFLDDMAEFHLLSMEGSSELEELALREGLRRVHNEDDTERPCS